MQTVASGFTAEERDATRSIAQNLLVSWKKDTNLAARTFTIGVSYIAGDDLIGINPGSIGSPSNYVYFDETDYLMNMAWERGLNIPTGGITKAMAEALLSNTTNRFTPRYMGGNSELFTAILPRRPFIINSGFNYNGVDQTIPQVTGITTKQVEVNQRNRTARIQGSDYIDFFQNRYLDQESVFTSQTTDTVMESMLSQLGMSTAQYSLDPGINVIPFGLFRKGTKFSDIFHQLAEAENGHFFQDESGKFYFKNRQWGDSSPYDTVQRIILTSQVISSQTPTEDNIINVVEVKSKVFEKQPAQTIFTLPVLSSIAIEGNSYTDQFFEFDDPVLALTLPTSGGTASYFVANTKPDGTGTNKTTSVSAQSLGTFATSAKIRFTNTFAQTVYLTQIVISGRVAHHTTDIYVRNRDDSSATAYNERPLQIENDYIQNESWANSYSQMILDDFSEPENLQTITIRAIPELQLFDLISWQGRHWRVYNIRNTLDPESGYVQELTLLQREIIKYFRPGISLIGDVDKIAP